MNGYLIQNELDSENAEDICPITQDCVNLNNLSEERHKFIFIDNGTFAQPYNTKNLSKWVEYKKTNPTTRKLFGQDELNYINFYDYCSNNFDNKENRKNYEMSIGLDIPDDGLYREYINLKISLENNNSKYTQSQAEYINDYARCSLNITDFQSHFKRYENIDSLNIIEKERAFVERYLLRHPYRWVLRQSSLNRSHDSPAGSLSRRGIKYYAISFVRDDKITHALITHRLGHGWYTSGKSVPSGPVFTNFVDALEHHRTTFGLNFSGHTYSYF